MKSKIYFIQAKRDEGDESLAKKAEKLFLKIGLHNKIEKDSLVALKMHFGEQGNTGFIKPQWLEGIIHQIKAKTSRAFLTDANTLYVGSRSNSVDHLHLAWEHGFSLEKVGIPVIIADGLIGKDDEEVKINLSRVKRAKISSTIIHSDFLLCLSHLTGHLLTGIGGAIKNLGMGCASRAGKLEQHSDVHPRVNPKLCKNCSICLDYCPAQAIVQKDGSAFIQDERCIGCGECLVVCKVGAVRMRWDEDFRRTQEKMAEYAYSVWQLFKEKTGFLNFLIKITKDCDCMAKDQPQIVEDIGILASSDPVAIDKASVDLVAETTGKDVFRAGYDVDWSVQLVHGEKIGLGRLDYELIEVS
jgi:hypothetical protein